MLGEAEQKEGGKRINGNGNKETRIEAARYAVACQGKADERAVRELVCVLLLPCVAWSAAASHHKSAFLCGFLLLLEVSATGVYKCLQLNHTIGFLCLSPDACLSVSIFVDVRYTEKRQRYLHVNACISSSFARSELPSAGNSKTPFFFCSVYPARTLPQAKRGEKMANGKRKSTGQRR